MSIVLTSLFPLEFTPIRRCRKLSACESAAGHLHCACDSHSQTRAANIPTLTFIRASGNPHSKPTAIQILAFQNCKLLIQLTSVISGHFLYVARSRHGNDPDVPVPPIRNRNSGNPHSKRSWSGAAAHPALACKFRRPSSAVSRLSNSVDLPLSLAMWQFGRAAAIPRSSASVASSGSSRLRRLSSRSRGSPG